MVFSFDYSYSDQTDGKIEKISADRFYRCDEVITRDSSVDFALIRLDRKVPDRQPLVLSQDRVSVDQGLFVVGHPQGLPLKVSGSAYVRVNLEDRTYFKANLDTYKGCLLYTSPSPRDS